LKRRIHTKIVTRLAVLAGAVGIGPKVEPNSCVKLVLTNVLTVVGGEKRGTNWESFEEKPIRLPTQEAL
jgi:hypothetical protein